MEFSDINPFMRFAELQPAVVSNAPFKCSYDHRIFYIMDGNATLVLENDISELSAGTLIYFRSGTPYYFDGKVKVIVLNFDITRNNVSIRSPKRPRPLCDFDRNDILENELPQILSETIVVRNAFAIENKLQECITNYRFPTPISDAVTSAITKEILCYAVQNTQHMYGKIPDIVEKTVEFIRNNYDKPISNQAIAMVFGYHSIYLNRVFKEYTGMTLHQALINERLTISKRLLQSTDLKIESIAKDTGFNDRAQFCSTFRKNLGLSPMQYRRSKQKK